MKNSAEKWLFAVPGKKKAYILILAVLQAANGFSSVLYALFLRGVVDAAVAQDPPGFTRAVLGLVLLVAAQIALRAVIRWFTELSRSVFENLLKSRLAGALLHSSYRQVSTVHSGEWMNRLTSDTVVVANGYVDILPGILSMAVKLVGAVVMIILLEPRFAAVLLPCGAALLLFSTIFRKTIKRLHKKVQEADGALRIFLTERIGSLLMLKSFAAEKQTEKALDEKLTAHQAARMHKNRFSNLCNIGFGGIMNGMYLLGVFWCGYGILKGTVTFGTLTAVTQLISQIQTPFANITGYLPRYYAMCASAERLMEAEGFDADEDTAADLDAARDFYDEELSSFGLEGASFAYKPPAGENAPEDLPEVIKNLSLEIPKGSYTAFAGPSGCGKSTTLKLLMCVYEPEEGVRYWKDASGNKKPLTGKMRRLFAYVPQGNHLMSGTIREAVALSDPAAAKDEERLNRALTIACAKEFVDRLEKGVDTLLGERGTGLSEGQMQRLAIARAVFSESPVLLLDEVTSALDAETESRLLVNLQKMTDRTVIVITHRKAALAICDRVYRFSEEGVAEEERDSREGRMKG